MSLQQFNKQVFNREVFKFIQENLGNHDTELLKWIKYSFSLAAPWREKAYLLFAVGEGLGIKKEKLLPLAIASELIMAAALTADDVFDQSLERENKDSLYKKIGTNKTFLIAETMFALAIKSMTGSFQTINKDLDSTTQQKIVGLFVDAYLGVQKFQYWRSSRNAKTLTALTPDIIQEEYGIGVGQLFVATLTAPACLSEQTKQFSSLEFIGKFLGICLQINNDIADFTWSKSNLGRNDLEDLYNSQPNIVLVFLLKSQTISTQDKNYILNIWTNTSHKTKKQNKRIETIIQQSRAIETAKQYLDILLSGVNKKINNLSDKNLQIKIKEVVEIIHGV